VAAYQQTGVTDFVLSSTPWRRRSVLIDARENITLLPADWIPST
jgi:hypothetical protein